MRILQTVAAAAIVFCAFGAGVANAGVVLSDNFDSDTAVLNWSGDSVFQSLPQPGNVYGQPSVDLVGVGDGYGSLAYIGNSVDLDGSTGYGNAPIAGEIQSINSLAFGDYTVSFMLAGNLRGATPQTTVVSIGGQSFSFTPDASQPYTLETLYFTGVSGQLDFKDTPVSDQQGNLLDNVVVTSGVPEPASWTLMIAGFGLAGLAMRRRRKEGVLAAA
jgi:hypothetical protein